ncbi:type I-B CRISPR-associated protein Cas7/Csh2 [Clostridium polynesiense]|uniref:type I-B CRISPR-associated protein Cas7/Csh2 n=1 Tax=Clostridium polynesiense TaxID=1325933 RepID=UPI00058C3647|nr:type I-B CRISPR-associated protein Cas7/Csh2 [Clostridium polynesiense]
MKNSEILYLYDAKLTNPNGDPDEENRPRMDGDINLVSDLRMKRYIRDYLQSRGKTLFVQKLDDAPVTAGDRIAELKETDTDKLLDRLIDVRLFGATMPVKNDSKNFIGPVQFNWGYSLNQVELLESSITSHFSSEKGNKQGAIGKDYRVKYSFIAFSGVISGKRAEKTRLTEEDVKLLDEGMKNAIPEQITRSKIGQYPRLYMRVEYKDDETILGDMRSKLQLIGETYSLKDITEVKLEIGRLIEHIKKYESKISKIYYYHQEDLHLYSYGKEVSFQEAFDFIDIINL